MFSFGGLDNTDRFYEGAMSFALPVYRSQITNWFDPNRVGVPASVECSENKSTGLARGIRLYSVGGAEVCPARVRTNNRRPAEPL